MQRPTTKIFGGTALGFIHLLAVKLIDVIGETLECVLT